jgi:hypothetical protein
MLCKCLFDSSTRFRPLEPSSTAFLLFEHTLSAQLQFKLFLAQQPTKSLRKRSIIDSNIVRLDCTRLAHISTARSVRSLGVRPYDYRQSTNGQNTPRTVTITRNLQRTSYTCDYNLTCIYDAHAYAFFRYYCCLSISFDRQPHRLFI